MTGLPMLWCCSLWPSQGGTVVLVCVQVLARRAWGVREAARLVAWLR